MPRAFNVRSIAIIGAGTTGLAATKYLLAERAFSRIVIFEQRSRVGGIWNYVPTSSSSLKELSIPQTNPHAELDKPLWGRAVNSTGVSINGGRSGEVEFMSPLYDRLETNIPRSLMGFSDLDWPKDCQLFPKHEEVLDYIEEYAQEVKHLIRFETQVLDVRLVEEERWAITSQSVAQDEVSEVHEEAFDAVIVASGHFNVPYIPPVHGMEEWNRRYPGSISHSKFYRRPEDYADKKVIIVGKSASGIDIGSQVAEFCRLPLLQSQKSGSFMQSDHTPRKQEKAEISHFDAEAGVVRFADGTAEHDVDAILYCTGYFYSFPFMQSLSPALVTDGTHVENLYVHFIYRPHPTLALPVLNQKIIPFPMAEAQAAVIAGLWSNRLRSKLPSEDDMESWEARTLECTGGGRAFHVLKFPDDADYINFCHSWSRSPVGGGHAGKEPPWWGEKERWVRERIPRIKKAFQDLGERRHDARTLQDVGFSFDEYEGRGEKGKSRLEC